MSTKYLNGFALAVLALAIIKEADAFVPQGRSARESQTLFVLPKIIKKGEKVETEVDVVGVVKAFGFLGGGVVALGAAFIGPQNGIVLPLNLPLNLPSISLPSKSSIADAAKSKVDSFSTKTEKKIVKAKKTSKSTGGYDLELDESLRGSATKQSTTSSFDREAATKEADEARQAAKAKSKAAVAEKQAALEARKVEAEAGRNKLAEEKAEKDTARTKAQEEKKGQAAATKSTKDEANVVKEDEEKNKVAAENVKEEEKTVKAVEGKDGEMKTAKEAESAAVNVVKAAEPKVEEATKTPEKPAPIPSPSPKSKSAPSGGALGKISGTASGGQILQKEEVSADVINTLKKYK